MSRDTVDSGNTNQQANVQGVDRDQLLAYLDRLLAWPHGDYCPNGLQVEGRQEIRRLVTGVSSCQEIFQRARSLRADAVLVHHGIFWDGDPAPLTGVQFNRVRELIEGGLNLLAYHLPLDAHSELGNNALAAHAYGLEELVPFGQAKGQPVGFRGRFPTPIEPQELQRRTAGIYGQEPLAFLSGPDPVSSLGIVSGGSQSMLREAIAAGLDAFVTGEATEWVMNLAREAGIHYFAAGHYATERLGVRALGEHLAEKFGIEAEFVDIPNPV